MLSNFWTLASGYPNTSKSLTLIISLAWPFIENTYWLFERAGFGRLLIVIIKDNWEPCGEKHQCIAMLGSVHSTEFFFYQQFENCSIKFWLKYAKHWKWDGPTTFYIKTQKTLQLKKQKLHFHKNKDIYYKSVVNFWNEPVSYPENNHILFIQSHFLVWRCVLG